MYTVVGSWRHPKSFYALDADHAISRYVASFNGTADSFVKEIGKRLSFTVTVEATKEVLEIPTPIIAVNVKI